MATSKNIRGLQTGRPEEGSHHFPNKVTFSLPIAVLIAICVILLVAVVQILFFLCRTLLSLITNWKKRKTRDVEAFIENYQSLAPKRFRYSELKNMTDSFKDKLGQGGYGDIFKGKLPDGRTVAVKVLNEPKGGGEDFINEVASIGRTYHVNIVSLLGFCFEGPKRALIYEFMPNGSLDKFIFAEKGRTLQPLGWEKLYQIALGIARGLDYLHRGCSAHILHLDIKPHNILLDQDFSPKISDFGLAKLCPTKEILISMPDARGTAGYMAPEVYCRDVGRVSYKSDVYSYGMMVLEMVGGRKNIDVGVDNISEIYFPHWIYDRIGRQGDIGLEDSATEAENETARKMTLVGLCCIQTDSANRPSMGDVVEMLEGSVEDLQVPPKPFLFST
ncbi:rust resistance kinase Lr10-like [Tasmannia lanceolata]|uniref:rust resistance kinase Lr10-like n=1 Tax=Tasmannia lanceolata TaxID=3420 RepID=UPI0040639F07